MSLKDDIAKLEEDLPPPQCEAITSRNKNCRNKAIADTQYCRVHQNWEPTKRKSKVVSKPEVTDRLFAEALIRNELNATAAYKEIKPHVSDKTAGVEGCKLLKKPSMVETIVPMLEKLFVKAGIETEYVFRRWVEFAQATPLDYFDVDDEGVMLLKATDKLTPAQRTNLRKLTVTVNETRNKKGDRLYVTQRTTVEVVDQQRAVESIAKHLGLLVDKMADEDVERIGDLIERGVNRIRETKDLDGWKEIELGVDYKEAR